MCAHHDDEGWEAGEVETRRSLGGDLVPAPEKDLAVVGVLANWLQMTVSFFFVTPLLACSAVEKAKGKSAGQPTTKRLTHTFSVVRRRIILGPGCVLLLDCSAVCVLCCVSPAVPR